MGSHNQRRHLQDGLLSVAASRRPRMKPSKSPSISTIQSQKQPLLSHSGWPIFETQEKLRGLVVKRHDDLRTTYGASYEISTQSLDACHQDDTVYAIHIAQLKYDADNTCSVRNAIELNIKSITQKPLDRSDLLSDNDIMENFISAHFFGETVTLESAHKISNAALVSAYIMSRIDKGIIPDIKRLLRLYKLI